LEINHYPPTFFDYTKEVVKKRIYELKSL